MSVKENQDQLNYVDRAFTAFVEIMSGKHKNMLENINRGNKGELFVLRFLTMRNTDVIPSELSSALQASTARISALLGALERKGQITRVTDERNRRNIIVNITEAGRDRVASEMQEHKNMITRIFNDMGEADTSEFIRLTRRFSQLMQKHLLEDTEECGICE